MSSSITKRHEWVAEIQVLSFDLDDTLWDCPPVIEVAEAKLFDWFKANAPKAVVGNYKDNMLRYRAEVVESHPEYACDMSLLRHKMIERCLVEAGYSAQLTEAAYDLFYQARSDVILYQGTHGVLDALGQRYKMAVITNGNADLSMIGLADKFHHYQRASIDNAPKPHAQMFEACLAEFDVPPSALAHIGDNVRTDVGGGQAIGAKTIWYNQAQAPWPQDQPKADAEVRSLQELLELFIPEPA